MTSNDLLCFSHLRWDFVFQRPNHLMSQCAKTFRVAFVEEPIVGAPSHYLETIEVAPRLWRVVPHLRDQQSPGDVASIVAHLLHDFCAARDIVRPVHWYYTPMMLPIGDRLPNDVVVYDCMDELRNFLGAPSELALLEEQLFRTADVVFTGGRALYEAKRSFHSNIHAVPSSVDGDFFAQARLNPPEPRDLVAIGRPRAGYCGVIDERLDLELLAHLADRFPDLHVVMLGPVVKIDVSSLPIRPNIHYLGGKSYSELPSYLAYWDIALMPFALNEATRFISPTKTPEYLAAGRPVVSTAVHDVVEPYERLGLVQIGRTHEAFSAHVGALLSGAHAVDEPARDAFLARMSWQSTWAFMEERIREAQGARHHRPTQAAQVTTQGGAHV